MDDREFLHQQVLDYTRAEQGEPVEAELTSGPQCTAQPSSTSSVTTHHSDLAPPPAVFDFPSPAIDSSLHALLSLSSPRMSRTPPAALSSAGAELAMASNMSSNSSSTSLADSNYDMLDDASEFSDDRDTASLPSTDHHDSDGAMTPEGSVVDVEEEHGDDIDVSEDPIVEQHGSYDTLPGVQKEVDEATKEENSLLDSYLNDELETPRQSTIHRAGAPITALSDSITSAPSPSPQAAAMTSLKVLFVSKCNKFDEIVVKLFKTLASSLSLSNDPVSEFEYQVLGPFAARDDSASTLVVRFREIELLVQHCKDATEQATTPPSYLLKLDKDQYRGLTRTYTDDQTNNKGPAAPDFVVFYVNYSCEKYPYWFTTVKKALKTRSVPVMTVGDRSGRLSWDSTMAREDKAAYAEGSDIVTDATSLGGKKVRRNMQTLLKLHPTQEASTVALAAPKFAGEKTPSASSKKGRSRESLMWSVLSQLAGFLVLAMCSVYAFDLYPTSFAAHVDIRREVLSYELDRMAIQTNTTNTFNIEHLVPTSRPMKGEYEGFNFEARSQGMDPNHIIVSLPKKNSSWFYLRPAHTTVYKSVGQEIDFNLSKLLGGIYDITIDQELAFGTVFINMLTKNSPLNVTVSHKFGSRSLQRTTTDMTTSLNKDITVARQRLQDLKEKVGLEFAAGAAATNNVTTELAVYVARDVQAFVNSATTGLSKAYNGVTDRMARFRSAVPRETHNALFSMQRKVSKVKRGIKNSITAKKDAVVEANHRRLQWNAANRATAKHSIRSALIAGRTKAMAVKSSLFGRQEVPANSTSATKELSLRVQNLWNPTEKSMRAGSLREIASCAKEEDYAACRSKQRAAAKTPMPPQPPPPIIRYPDAVGWAAKRSSKLPPQPPPPVDPTIIVSSGGGGKPHKSVINSGSSKDDKDLQARAKKTLAEAEKVQKKYEQFKAKEAERAKRKGKKDGGARKVNRVNLV